MSTPESAQDTGGRWVDVTDVTARYEGRIPPAQRARVATFIRDAESILRRRVPRLTERITESTDPEPGDLPASEVKRVVAQAVMRALSPGGGRLQQYSAGEGAFTETRGYMSGPRDGPERTGGVQFTEEELEDLREHRTTPDGFGVVHQQIPRWRIP